MSIRKRWTRQSRPLESIRVVPFAPRHAAAFRNLNVAWITAHFQVEPMDLAILEHPGRSILDRGGAILIAEEEGLAMGCVALIPHGGDGTLELAKMAVAESHRGRGVGRRLVTEAISQARSVSAPRLYLESNTLLVPALRLYESVGFRRVPELSGTRSPYRRVDIHGVGASDRPWGGEFPGPVACRAGGDAAPHPHVHRLVPWPFGRWRDGPQQPRHRPTPRPRSIPRPRELIALVC
jgi:putative acetyltransferase